jgi:hypothetical protein
MQSLPIIFMFIGCEPVTPSGNPLEPATVAAVASQTVAPAATEDAADGAQEEQEEAQEDAKFTISSEELNQLAKGEIPGTEEPEAEVAEDKPSAEDVTETRPVPETAEPPTSGWKQAVGKAWPVRLVTTVPNATPPRAILGLPNGKEIVVNPGSMVPEMGLVVVAISPNSAEIARIAPAGDHATIESMTLRAQY